MAEKIGRKEGLYVGIAGQHGAHCITGRAGFKWLVVEQGMEQGFALLYIDGESFGAVLLRIDEGADVGLIFANG